MTSLLRRIALTVAVLASVCSGVAQQEPWDKSGTPAGALINGIQSSLERAKMGARSAPGQPMGPISIASISERYNATYGPYLDGMGFDMTKFMGTAEVTGSPGVQAVQARRGVVFLLIKLMFLVAIMLTFVNVAFAANKKQASITDLGWSLAKAAIAALVVCFPGGLYALFIILPLSLSTIFAHSEANGTLDRHSSVAVLSSMAVRDGVNAAESMVDAAMASCASASVEDYRAVYNLAEAAVAIATQIHLPASVTNAIVFPPKNAAHEFAVEGVAVMEKGQPKKDPITHEVVYSTPPVDRATIIAVKQQFAMVLHADMGLWRYWVNMPEIGWIKTMQSKAEIDLASLSGNADATEEKLREIRLSAYNTMKDLVVEQILDRRATGRDPDWASTRERNRLKLAGLARMQRFEAANEDASWGDKTLKTISTFMLTMLMPIIAGAWIFVIDILMLQLLVMAALWIHPKTEPGAVKAAMYLLSAAFFMPVYLIAFLLLQKFLSIVLPGMPNPEGGALNAVGAVVQVLVYPSRIIAAIVFSILAPVAAIPLAWFMFKTVKSGGTFVGGIAKAALTTAGAAATMSMPLLRAAAMVAGTGLAGAAGGLAASAASSPLGLRRRVLGGASWASRMAAGAADYGQDAMGKAFGVNDKYMNKSLTGAQNRAGAVAAMKSAASGSIKAMMSGGNTSSIIEHIESKAEIHEKLRSSGGEGDPPGESAGQSHATAQELVEAQRQQSKASAKVVEGLEALVQKLDRIGNVVPARAATGSASQSSSPTPAPAPLGRQSTPVDTGADTRGPVAVSITLRDVSSTMPPPPVMPKTHSHVEAATSSIP